MNDIGDRMFVIGCVKYSFYLRKKPGLSKMPASLFIGEAGIFTS
jgi:hypothetical protein